MTDRPDVDGAHLRSAMHRHPAGQRRPLRAVPKDSHTWGQGSRPGSGDPVNTLLTLVFVIVFAAGVGVGVWVDWRWLATASAVDLVIAWVGGHRQRRADR